MSRPMVWLAGVLFVLLVGSGSSNAGVAQSSATGSPASGMVVTGIVGGRSRIAIIESEGQSYLVGVGDRIGGATVEAISGTEVVFKQGKRTFTLQVAHAAHPSATVGGGLSPATAAPPSATAGAVSAKDNATPIAGAPVAAPQPEGASGPAQPQLPRISIRSLGTPVYAPLAPAGVPDTIQSTVPLFEPPLPAETSTQPLPAIAPVVPSGVTGYSPLARPSEPTTTRSPVTSLAAPQPAGVSSSPQPSNAPTLPAGTPLYSPVGTPAAPPSTPAASAGTQNPATVPGTSPPQPAVGPAPQQPAIAPGPAAAPGTVVPPAPPPAASSQATPSRGYVQLYLVKVGPISTRHRAEEIASRLIKAGFAARVSVTGTQFTITLKPSTQQAVGRSLAIVQSVQADVPVKIELSP